MILEELTIREGIHTKKVVFSNCVNLVYSNKNSVGKTTLLRFLLYALGYSIPSTKGIRFEKCEIELNLKSFGIPYHIFRQNDYLEVTSHNSTTVYVLPNDLGEFHSILFKTSNQDILQNLLGSFYIDQEKGWTLLNRGVAIGKNKFNIEQLIRGLSENDCHSIILEAKQIEYELNKYKQMFNIAQYQEEINAVNGSISYEKHTDIIDKDVMILSMERNTIKRELKRLNSVLSSNNSFINYIERMKISVKSHNGDILPVNQSTIVGFDDNHELLLAKRRLVTNELSAINSKIEKLEQQKQKDDVMVTTETLIQSFDQSIAKLNIDSVTVKNIIEKLEKELSNIRKRVTEITKSNSAIIKELHYVVSTYSEELNVSEFIKLNEDYLFTRDLKSLSGAILHKIVFAFKLAYIRTIDSKLGIKLPIILDSPSGRELAQFNIDEMMHILERDFKENQIIIASIHKYTFKNPTVIELQEHLMDSV